MRKMTVWIALALFVPLAASAQGILGPFTVSAGAGLDVGHLADNNVFTPGTTFNAGLTFQRPDSRWGLRLGAWFYNREERTGPVDSRAQVAALGLDVRYDAGRGDTHPYVFGGLGIGAFYLSQNANVLRNSGSLFMTGGAGLERHLGRVTVFGELRLVHPFNGANFTTYLAPLSFGVRF